MLSLFMLLVGSISSAGSLAAQPTEPSCENGQVLDEGSGLCVEPTVDAGLEPTVDPNVPTEEAVEPSGSADVMAYKFTCPMGYDRHDSNADPASDCTDATDGVTFTYTSDTQNLQTNTGDSIPGAVMFGGVDAGSFTLAEVLPPGTESTFHICDTGDGSGTLEDGDSYSGELASGDALTCTWYNVPFETGSIYIVKTLCDDGFDPAGKNLEELDSNCDTNPGPTEFSVTDENGGVTTQNTSGATPNDTMFPLVPIGNVTVEEKLSDGFGEPVIACTTDVLNGTIKPDYSLYPVTNDNQLKLELHAGDTYSCIWYNVPESDTTPTVTTTSDDSITFTVYKFVCPAGYDASGNDADPKVDCATPQDGVQYNLAGTNTGYTSQSNTGDSIPGAVTFGGLEPDTYTMTETFPAGTQSAFVTYCTLATPTDSDVPIYPTVSMEHSIQFDLNAGETITCYWYNVPDADTTPTVEPTTATDVTPTIEPTFDGSDNGTPTGTGGTIYVYKWTCPAGYDASAPIVDAATDCPTATDGVTFTLTGGPFPLQTNTGDSIPGAVMFGGVAAGTYDLTESIPVAVQSAFITTCDVVNGGSTTTINPTVDASGKISISVADGDVITCHWYNIPYPESGDLTIHKQDCTTATYVDDTSCTPNTSGVSFDIYRWDGTGWVYLQTATTDGLGVIALSGLLPGQFKVTEVGYVPCNIKATQLDGDGTPVDAINPDGSVEVTNGRETVVVVSNCTGGNGDITIYKWTCPPGYDYTRPGADPKVDCTQATDGVTFVLQQQDGTSPYFSQSDTGDSIPGAVYFGGAPVGTYTVTETVPAGTWYAFVWDCTGGSTSWVNPAPLSLGDVLDLKLANKDAIVCNWYNVPYPDPESGDLTIHKHICSGATYVSEVNCDTYEDGATFEILVWDGANWVSVTTETTNSLGAIALSGLTPGTYQIDEKDADPCRVTAIQQDGNGNKVNVKNGDGTVEVTDGRETVVDVYNCVPPGKKPQPTKTPTKFPNTGVNPEAALAPAPVAAIAQEPTETPESDNSDQVIEPDSDTSHSADDGVTCPELSTADGVTDGAGTPVATPEAGEPCARGPVPANISIPSIEVEATIEVKEILDGEMQEPTDESVVTWYKETNRLGETGNIVLAGHLNYWGVPEAVFFNLGKLQKGDLIELTDADGNTYTYAVTSVAELPISDGPEEVVAPTDGQTLTLMTCGGEWDASVSEYDHRTVVQAVRVETGEQ